MAWPLNNYSKIANKIKVKCRILMIVKMNYRYVRLDALKLTSSSPSDPIECTFMIAELT